MIKRFIKNKGKKIWRAYLLRCSDGSLYCGITNDLQKRLKAHNLGKGSRYTRSRTPVELVAVGHEMMTKSDALKLEHRIKKLSAERKIPALKTELGSDMNDFQKIAEDLQLIINDTQRIMEMLDRCIGNESISLTFCKARENRCDNARRV